VSICTPSTTRHSGFGHISETPQRGRWPPTNGTARISSDATGLLHTGQAPGLLDSAPSPNSGFPVSTLMPYASIWQLSTARHCGFGHVSATPARVFVPPSTGTENHLVTLTIDFFHRCLQCANIHSFVARIKISVS
jgi:hypothetical protein